MTAEGQPSKTVSPAKAGERNAGDEEAAPRGHVASRHPRRVPGALKGIWPEIPDSFFFDPLPEEELRLWDTIELIPEPNLRDI